MVINLLATYADACMYINYPPMYAQRDTRAYIATRSFEQNVTVKLLVLWKIKNFYKLF